MMKFRQCMTRGLTLVKMYFVTCMKNIQIEVKEKVSERVSEMLCANK
jgi:hypothetical protein